MDLSAVEVGALFMLCLITGVNVRLQNFGIAAFSFALLVVGLAKVLCS